MQFQLYEEINKNEELMNVLSEPANITIERETLQKTLDVLVKARKAINRDPELSTSFGKEEELDQPRERKWVKCWEAKFMRNIINDFLCFY